MYSNKMIYSATGAGLIAALVVYMINKKFSGNESTDQTDPKSTSDASNVSTSSADPSTTSSIASTSSTSSASEPSSKVSTDTATSSKQGGTRRKRPLHKGRKSVNKCQYCKCTQK